MHSIGPSREDHPRKARLAEGPCAAIDQCPCGTFYVSIGALTLRLSPEVVASVWETIGEALARAAEANDAPTAKTNVRPTPGSVS